MPWKIQKPPTNERGKTLKTKEVNLPDLTVGASVLSADSKASTRKSKKERVRLVLKIRKTPTGLFLEGNLFQGSILICGTNYSKS